MTFTIPEWLIWMLSGGGLCSIGWVLFFVLVTQRYNKKSKKETPVEVVNKKRV